MLQVRKIKPIKTTPRHATPRIVFRNVGFSANNTLCDIYIYMSCYSIENVKYIRLLLQHHITRAFRHCVNEGFTIKYYEPLLQIIT